MSSKFLTSWKALPDLFLFTKCFGYLFGTDSAWPIVAAADAKKEDLLTACSLFQRHRTPMSHAHAHTRTRTHPHSRTNTHTHTTHTHTHTSMHPSGRFNVLHRYLFEFRFLSSLNVRYLFLHGGRPSRASTYGESSSSCKAARTPGCTCPPKAHPQIELTGECRHVHSSA